MDVCKANILIVDDRQEICQLVCDDLSLEGYQCSVALNGQEALTQLEMGNFDVVLLDIRLPDISGLEILKRIASSFCTTASIVISGVDSIATAVEAMKRGAADYIVKPFTLARVRTSIQKVLKDVSQSSCGLDTKPSSDGSDDITFPGDKTHKELDAIASGVQVRHDLILGHFKIIIRETVEVARRLGLPEAAIQRWIKARTKQESEKKRDIRRSLAKLEGRLVAQELLGLMKPYSYSSQDNENWN